MVSPNRAQEQQFPCNITFDQLGNVGKPLSTMKLDEFLKNVMSAEEGHELLQNANPSSSSSSCSSSSSASPFFLGNFELNNGTLSSKKPVNDVWKEVNNQERLNIMDNQSIQQQLGESSLEDFLVRAGVINLGNQNALLNPHQPIMAIDPMVVVSQQADWLQFQMAAVHQEQQQQTQMPVLDSDFHVSESVYENPVVDVGYSDNQLAMNMPMPAAISATSVESQSTAEKKCRYSDEIMEKTIERRQKRMIKNRESAARSRARKQAYTNQLEHEVLQLQKTNSWLKKLKEQEMLLSCNPIPTPRYQLRRTSSSSF